MITPFNDVIKMKKFHHKVSTTKIASHKKGLLM